MTDWPRTLEPIAIDSIGYRSVGLNDNAVLTVARKRSRSAIVLLAVMYLVAITIFPEDVLVALAVLLAGVSTWLESAHGAIAFDRLIRRLFQSI